MNKLTQSELRMQMLAGVITEGEYTAIINKETEEEEKSSLNESMIGGIVGVGAINQIPATPKTDYEMAFEHFLGEKYTLKPNRERADIKDINEEEEVEEGKKGKMYFHVLEDGGYGEIGHQGVYDTKEEAQNRADSLSDMFPDSSFYVEASDSEDEPYSVTMEEGKEEVEEGDNDLFTAKRFSKRTDNPRINILSHMGAINDIVMDMLETDLVKGYGPDERDNIYQEYMKFANAIKNLVK
jgi:hypothetical protein